MIQDTSLEAYNVLRPKLGRKQLILYNLMQKYPRLSINQICRLQNCDAKNVTGRLMELRHKGLVVHNGYNTDPITQMRNKMWSVVR